MEIEITPTQKELLAIIALLWAECDSLRSRLGSGATIITSQRVFSNEDVVRGSHYLPHAHVKTNGSIIVRMES